MWCRHVFLMSRNVKKHVPKFNGRILVNKNNIKDYRKISERMWNLPDKGEIESHREETYEQFRMNYL